MDYERPGDERLSHRDRKKLQTTRRIHAMALDLARQMPYEEVTVESIAARSGVSESTVYRYFSTKEGVFLWDEYDDAFMEEFRILLDQHDPIEAMTKALSSVVSGRFDLDSERALTQLTLIQRVEPLRDTMAAHTDELRKAMATVVSEAGWPALEANVFAAAVIGAFTAAIENWVATGGSEPLPWLFARSVDLLAEGLHLDSRTSSAVDDTVDETTQPG